MSPSPSNPSRIQWILRAAALVAILVLVILYWSIKNTSQPDTSDVLVPQVQHPQYTHPLVLSLTNTVTDKEGVPYTGTVLYDPTSETYSYIALQEEGLVTPVEPSAFSWEPYYLAIRAGTSTNHLIMYDYSTLLPVRVIEDLSMGESIAATIWSSDVSKFAYTVIGNEIPALFIEDFDGADPFSPGFDFPVGFSPDNNKILTRGTSTPVLIDLEDGSFALTAGLNKYDAAMKFFLAPSGNYLITLLGKDMEWYRVDWDNGSFTSVANTSLATDAVDVIIAPDDSLIVREGGSDVIKTYSFNEETQELVELSFSISLPDEARILHVILW